MPTGLQSLSSTLLGCCLQWMVWPGCPETTPFWDCRAGCSCACGRHISAAGFATAFPPQCLPYHPGRLMQGENGFGVHHCSAGGILADLTCCAFSPAQGLKPPTCPACWSSLRSLKVWIWHAVPTGLLHAMLASLGCPCSSCQGGSGRVVMLLPVGSCYPAWVFCPVAVSASISLACGNTWGPHGNQKGGEESVKGKGCAALFFRELGFRCCALLSCSWCSLLTLFFSPTCCHSHLPVVFSAKKEETPVQPPEERQLTGSSG